MVSSEWLEGGYHLFSNFSIVKLIAFVIRKKIFFPNKKAKTMVPNMDRQTHI